MSRLYDKNLQYYLRASITIKILLLSLLFHNGCAGHAGHMPVTGSSGYSETGMASYYARKYQNRKTASGERFNNNSFTAAHKTLPFGTKVIVKNMNTGKSVKVRINDRGPFIKGRIIDLSRAAFSQIADLDDGLAKVEIRIVK